MEKLILIDGNSLINRAFYATPPMSNAKGVPTNAVLGFVNMLVKLVSDEKPDYMLVAFDRKEPTFRHEIYADYKGTRKPMPDDLRPQIPLLKEVLDAMNIAHFDSPGLEADDIIGTLSKRFDVQTVVVTGDRDSFQLVDGTTSVYYTKRGITDIDVLTEGNFVEKLGYTPLQVVEMKALMGDKSDNIPGIPGVGEKTALDLITRFASVEGIYDNLSDISGKLKEKIEANKEICLLSKKLATINTSAAVGVELKDIKFKFPFPSALKRMFVELEFRSLLKKDSLFSEAEDESVAVGEEPQVIQVTSVDQILPLFKKRVAVHIGDDISLCSGGAEYKISIKQSFFDEGFMYDEAVRMLAPLFENKDAHVILFSRKKTEHALAEFGVKLHAFADDVSLKKYIADFTGKEESLDDLILYYNLPAKFYAHALFVLDGMLSNILKENGQELLYTDIELPLAKVLYQMETTGFKVDEDILDELNKKYRAILADLTAKIHELAGEKFNINSPKQLGVILFDKLQLNSGKKKKANYSTSAEVLEEIYDDHEIVPLILQYRRISKLNSTYVEGFRPMIDKKTGLIHTVFNQTLTSTGRLSSKEPNLQNLPVRDEEGREIRRFFVPSDGDHVLVGADYSQIELRLLAHFSGSEMLIDAYKRDEDIHSLTASQVFGVALSDVTKDMRRKAKAVNFGIIYGISEYGLAKNVKTSPREARDYISRYFQSYPSVKEYMDANVDFARKNGYVSTLCGRKRFIRDINSPNYNLRSFSERAAMNMPLQGSSADIIKIAMIRVAARLERENLKSRLILQVHDELVVDALISEKSQVERILKEEMEGAASLNVPLVVDVYSGKNLSEAK